MKTNKQKLDKVAQQEAFNQKINDLRKEEIKKDLEFAFREDECWCGNPDCTGDDL